MKTYTLFIIFLHLGATLGADLNRATFNLPIPPAGHGRPHSTSDTPPPSPVITRRPIPFEPHLRRMEEDIIRQMHFKIGLRSGSKRIKLTIRGYLRDREVLKQNIDIEIED